MARIWKVIAVNGEELEKYLNAGWNLSQFEIIKKRGSFFEDVIVFAVIFYDSIK